MTTQLVRVLVIAVFLLSSFAAAGFAQTTAFTYQGRLTDSSMAANGQYDMQFRLYDDPDAGEGTQHGLVVSLPAVQVSGGIFTVQLDFGSATTCPTCFDGSDRYLEVSLRPAGSAGGYTDLGPRPKINSAPYANRSALATNALNLGGAAASQYVQTNDGRLSDARNPLPGSTNYIQNTVSPQTGTANFNINGNGVIGNRLTVGNGSAAQPTLRFAASANSGLYSSGIDAINFSTAGTSRIHINPNGNVGIGTTSPSSNLSLSGETDQQLAMEFRTTPDSPGRQLAIRAGSAAVSGLNQPGGLLILQSGFSTGTGTSSIAFQTGQPGSPGTAVNALTTRMTISGEGNVGLGTSPSLDTRLYVHRPGTENGTNFGLLVSNFTTSPDAVPFSEKTGALIINSGSTTASTSTGLRIENASQNVVRDGLNKYGLLINSSNTFSGGMGAATINRGLGVNVSGADVNYAATFSGGNVGIGTDSPSDTLQVTGNIRVGSGTTGCVRDADATVIAGTCSSDRRLKKNVYAFPNMLDRIVRLRPVTFYWRADEFKERSFGSSQSFGLVAQEVEQVMPELVTTDEKGYRAVRYNKLPLLLLQAVRELKSENDALRHRLQQQTANHEDRAQQQQKQIDALTKLVCAQNGQAEICKANK